MKALKEGPMHVRMMYMVMIWLDLEQMDLLLEIRPRARHLKELEVELESLIWSRWRSIEEWLKIGSSE